MRNLSIVILQFFLVVLSASATPVTDPVINDQLLKNQLSNSESLYLKKHAADPVQWQVWNQSSRELAVRLGRPIFLSIGYASCHWCSVMHKESFLSESVAEILNSQFIPIKVDREERPDIDRFFMRLVAEQGGRTGWPTNLILDAETQNLLFSSTYLEEPRLLSALNSDWKHGKIKKSKSRPTTLSTESFIARLQSEYDPINGGLGRAPKFPETTRIRALLRMSERDAATTRYVRQTLNSMSERGLFDHLNGGFFRFAEDARWERPHFEKLLYLNAELALTYLEAYQALSEEKYLTVARKTLDFMKDELLRIDGLFGSSLAAMDRDGREGGAYLFSSEVKKVLQESQLSEVVPGRFLPVGNIDRSTLIKLQRSFDDRELVIDSKVIVSWNALAVQAFAKAHQITNDMSYYRIAKRTGNMLVREYQQRGSLTHTYSTSEAFIDDYAQLISALLALYQSDYSERWIAIAEKLYSEQRGRLGAKEGVFRYSTEFPGVDFTPGLLPEGNLTTALNLYQLYGLMLRKEYRFDAERLLKNAEMKVNPFDVPMLKLTQTQMKAPKQLVVAPFGTAGVEADLATIRSEIGKGFYPTLSVAIAGDDESTLPLLAGKKPIGERTTFYLCEFGSCRLPETELSVVLASIGSL